MAPFYIFRHVRYWRMDGQSVLSSTIISWPSDKVLILRLKACELLCFLKCPFPFSVGDVETRSLLEAILAVVDANSKTLDSLNVSILKRVDDDFVARLSRKAKILRQLFILDSTELTDRGLRALAGETTARYWLILSTTVFHIILRATLITQLFLNRSLPAIDQIRCELVSKIDRRRR